MPAKYNLKAVQQYVQEWLDGNDDRMWFTPRRKSYGAVSFVCNEDDEIAQETIAKGFLKLNSDTFFNTQYLSGRGVAVDVYGLENYRRHNWYVKFYLIDEADDQCVASISFHPLDETMTCENGNVLAITFQGARPWKN